MNVKENKSIRGTIVLQYNEETFFDEESDKVVSERSIKVVREKSEVDSPAYRKFIDYLKENQGTDLQFNCVLETGSLYEAIYRVSELTDGNTVDYWLIIPFNEGSQ